jgi:hypothetical protein
MKKILSVMILGLFIISMIGMVSAGSINNVVVGGTIWDSAHVPITNTSVTVECKDPSNVTTFTDSNLITDGEGEYFIEIDNSQGTQCTLGDTVIVTATDYNVEEEDVVANSLLTVDIVIIEVTVPEFGFFLGALTILGAVGIFFFIKR